MRARQGGPKTRGRLDHKRRSQLDNLKLKTTTQVEVRLRFLCFPFQPRCVVEVVILSGTIVRSEPMLGNLLKSHEACSAGEEKLKSTFLSKQIRVYPVRATDAAAAEHDSC